MSSLAVSVDPAIPEPIHSREVRRKLWHMGPGFLPFILWVVPHYDPFSALELGILTAITVLLAAAFLGQRKRLGRLEESSLTLSVASYACVFLFPLFWFPGRAELAMGVLAIVAFGDGAASLAGRYFQGPVLPWNPRKTVAGLTAFVLFAWPMSALIYWGESRPALSMPAAAVVTGGATVAASLVESLDSRINDNLRVGLVSLAMLLILHGMLFGWSSAS